MVINKMGIHKKRQRALAHVEKIAWIRPIEGADNIELVGVLGWVCIAKIGEFQVGDWCVYIEIDSKVPEKEWSEFLRPKHFKIKTMKLGKFKVISQGIALPLSMFDVDIPQEEGKDVTKLLGVKYSVKEDNFRKSEIDKYKAMAQRRPDVFKKPWARGMMKNPVGKRIMFLLYGKKRDKETAFPTKFPFVHKTDQERCENMPWVLEDKTPFIRTQKCDGTSGTYILERKPFGRYEFYVCSRNVRMLRPDQDNFFGDKNPYWEMAIKYDIEKKMKDFLSSNKRLKYICWQGEICGPNIQKNPHHLKEEHLFMFHMIDSKVGFYDIREAAKWWTHYDLEHVPIDEQLYILPNSMEEFKLTADGLYNPKCCEGYSKAKREGYVYYKSTDPNFSFKNVSREYLLKAKM